MAIRKQRWAWILAWALILGCVVSLALLGRVAADDDDDDQAPVAVVIVESDGDTRVVEGGQDDGYTIVLTDAPLGSVVITLSADGQVSVDPKVITFTEANWGVAQTIAVMAVDDDVAEGPHAGVISHSVSSSDDRYDGLAVADVQVYITDNDLAGVTVAPTTVHVEEGGATGSYEVALGSRPTAAVTIHVSTDGQTRTNPSSLTFSPPNWGQPQQVTVTAEDGGVEEGEHQSTISHSVESADAAYNGISAPSVTAVIMDAKRPGVRITESGGGTRVTEGGQGDSYQIELTSRPSADVTVRITTDGQTTVAPSEITFTSSDWRQARSLAVSAVDDRRAEGEHTGIIRHTCTSADPAYDRIEIRDVVVTVIDNDVAGASIAPQHLDMVEGDAGVGYTVVLDSEPTGAVLLRITTDGLTATSPSELRFTPDDWYESRWVTVTAAADAIDRGTRTSEVRHTLVSEDDVYDGMPVDAVSVTIRDNERADVIVSAHVTDITERDGTTSFVLRLSSRPTSDVVIPLSSSSDRCRLALGAAVLTRDTWQEGVQVIVSANVDPSWHGEETCPISTGPTSSGDRSYDGRDPEDVVVTIRIARTVTGLCIPVALRTWPPLPGTPAMQPIDNPEGWGDYAVAWDAADRADSYLLQEAVDAAFATAREVYAGPNLAHVVAGRGAACYYYRAAAANSWGTSPWSVAVAVDVRWESEPNDDALTQANGPIMPDITYQGALESGTDVQDYYWLEMSDAGRIEVWLDGIPAGLNYDLVVRDASLSLVGYSAELGNRDEHILTDVLPAGRYYIQVYQRSGGGSPEPYSLRYALR